MSSVAGAPNPALAVTLAGIPAPSRYSSGGPRPAPGTVNKLFFAAIEKYDRPNALIHKVNGVWEPLSHKTILERVRRIALGLAALGVNKGERIGLLSENRPEWALIDYACTCAGLTDVPIYPTLPAEQIPYLLKDSGAEIVFVSTSEQARKIAGIRSQAPALKHLIGIAATKADGCDYTLAEIEAMGAALDSADAAAQFKREALEVSPEQLITLIYTSGTTGDPKGVMLTHNNIHSNVLGSHGVIPVGDGDMALSFLPLSHIFERTGAYALFAWGVPIAYAESIDTVPFNMTEIKPSVMMSVPRLYEKIYARVLENAVQSGGLKKQIFSVGQGRRRAMGRQAAHRRRTHRIAGVSVRHCAETCVLEVERAHGWQHEVLRVRRRTTLARNQQILLFGRAHHSRRLWADGNKPGDYRQHANRISNWHSWAADSWR